MKRIRGWLIILIILAGAIGGFLWFRNRAQLADEGQEILRTAVIESGDLAITVSASGNTSVNEKIDLRFATPGSIESVAAEINDRVKAGQELARVDTADLERAVQQAEIALEQAQLNLDILIKPTSEEDVDLAQLAVDSAAQALEVARIGKQTAQADADNMRVQAQRAREQAFIDLQNADASKKEGAQTNFERAEEQEYLAGINAELTVEQAQAQWLSAYSSYRQAVENLNKLQEPPNANQVRQAELQIEQAQLSLNQARGNLADAVLASPIAGRIVAANVKKGGHAPVEGMPVPAFTVVDDTDFYIDITVDEIEIGKVTVGQTADVTLDAYPDVILAGTVDSIAPSSINVGGVVSYRVKVHLDAGGTGEDVVLRDGMTASVVIQTGTVESILLVPNWAVKSDQSGPVSQLYSYVLRADGTPERRNITLGRYNGDFTEVLSGLEAGDTVALITEARSLFDFGLPGGR